MASVRRSTAYVLLAIVLFTSIAAVAANLGLFGLDPNSNFAKVTLTSVLVEIVAAFVYLAKQTYNNEPTTITAAIKFPNSVDESHLSNVRWDHANCIYEVMDAQANVTSRGQIALVLGNGGWECKIQNLDDIDNSVELRLVEEDGVVWEVPRFYPLTRTVNAIERRRDRIRAELSTTERAALDEKLPAMRPADSQYPKTVAPVREIKFNNVARLVRSSAEHDWYDWIVYVDEQVSVLNRIASVDYLLHRTFPNPLRNSDDPKSQFACKSTGWGTFMISITVHFKDNTELKTSYQLSFSKSWDKRFDHV